MARLDPASPLELAYKLLEVKLLALEPSIYFGIVLRLSIDLGVNIYPKLVLYLQAQVHYLGRTTMRSSYPAKE